MMAIASLIASSVMAGGICYQSQEESQFLIAPWQANLVTRP